jgi:hypothetical protein
VIGAETKDEVCKAYAQRQDEEHQRPKVPSFLESRTGELEDLDELCKNPTLQRESSCFPPSVRVFSAKLATLTPDGHCRGQDHDIDLPMPPLLVHKTPERVEKADTLVISWQSFRVRLREAPSPLLI